MKTAQWLSGQNLTKVGDHDGHLLVDGVEDHDDDEADDGGCDGCGHLRGQVLLDRVCPIGVRGKRRRKHDEHGQPVDNDPDHRGDNEQDLKPAVMTQCEPQQESVRAAWGRGGALAPRLQNEGAGALCGKSHIRATRKNGGEVGTNVRAERGSNYLSRTL